MGQVPTFEKKTCSYHLWGTECGSRLLWNIRTIYQSKQNITCLPNLRLLFT